MVTVYLTLASIVHLMRGNEKVSHWFRRAHMAWDSSIVALAICLITVFWCRCVVCASRKSGWRLFVSMKPLQPTWTDRVRSWSLVSTVCLHGHM